MARSFGKRRQRNAIDAKDEELAVVGIVLIGGGMTLTSLA